MTQVPQEITVTQFIQLMLAPAVMINACGLLILGINNKYSMVVNRIRLLNEEKRRLKHRADEREFTYEEGVRLESISRQLKQLIYRAKLVRNSVLCYTAAVALFVLTSLMIGVDYYNPMLNLKNVITGTFLVSMVVVLNGVGFAFFETRRAYEIVLFDVKADE